MTVDWPGPKRYKRRRSGVPMQLSFDQLLQPFFDGMKPADQWRIGAEAEKFGVDTKTGAAVPYEGERGVLAVMHAFEKLGWKAVTENAGGPLIALEKSKASV